MSPRVKHVEIEEAEAEATTRDFVMARLAAARVSAASAVSAIDEALELFVEVQEDEQGKDRATLISTALESVGCASRALESAEEVMPDVDPEECEPWDGDEDDEEEDEDEAPPVPRATARERRRS